MVQVTSCIIY